jgi:hypothetical protein
VAPARRNVLNIRTFIAHIRHRCVIQCFEVLPRLLRRTERHTVDLDDGHERVPHDDDAAGGNEVHEVLLDESLIQVEPDTFEAAQHGQFMTARFVAAVEEGHLGEECLVL